MTASSLLSSLLGDSSYWLPGSLLFSFSNSHKCLTFSLISASFSLCSPLSPSPFLSSYFCLSLSLSLMSVSIQSLFLLLLPCFSVSDINSLVASTSLCLSPFHIVFFFCSLKGDPNHEQRSEGPRQASYPEEEAPRQLFSLPCGVQPWLSVLPEHGCVWAEGRRPILPVIWRDVCAKC